MLIAFSPLALAFVAEQSAFERWSRSAGLPTVPEGEVEGAIVLAESGNASEFTQKIENRIKRRRSEDPNALSKATRSGVFTTVGPKVIRLFPSSSTPKAAIPSLTPGLGIGRNGSYRAICVRLCDGFYWPISYGTSRSADADDKQACESGCATEARLFYVPAGAETDEAVDVKGKPYSRLKNAYRYRNEYVPSCKCKPDPWEQSSLDRHKKYAELAKAGKLASLEDKGKKRRRKKQSVASTTYVSFDSSTAAIDPADGLAPEVIVPGKAKSKKSARKQKERSVAKVASVLKVIRLNATTKSTKRLNVVSVGSRRTGSANGESRR